MTSIPESVEFHPAFKLIRTEPLDALRLIVEEYEHLETGAKHLHLASNYDENVFLVALKTVPSDDSGVAHILEHTTLCGSEKYPVRDPFFMMIRRSLNTFMNAFTSSDWTAYPFASKNHKDFNNLLDVYLDAVFFPSLDLMDFAQEGHRLEFESASDSATNLCYKGVVYNEMKGAMSSPTSQLWQVLTRYLFPSSTYHFNSGGEPDAIPDLTYEALLAFHRKHYHPSNAVFMTFGNLPVIDHHKKMHEQVLSRFKKLDHDIFIKDERRYFSPVKVEEGYSLPRNEEMTAKTHIVIAWLLGHSFSLEEKLEAHILSEILLENSASPLQMALEKTELGHSPSPLCGLEDSNREMTFVCGIEGSEPGNAEKVEELVFNVLKKVVKEGVSSEKLEAIVHQLELTQREISGDSYPYGLQLILNGLSPMIHGGDPVAQLDVTPVLDNIRQKMKKADYAGNLVKRHLLDNAHRVTLTLKPDQKLDARKNQALSLKLKLIKQALSDLDVTRIKEQAVRLEARQKQEDDASILPKVGINDIPHDLTLPISTKISDAGPEITIYKKGTNGLVYIQSVIRIPELTSDELDLLPVYTSCLTELGCGDLDYLQMQDKLSSVTGGIACYSSLRGAIDDEQKLIGHLTLSAKGLFRNSASMTQLMSEFFHAVSFKEKARLRELVAHIRARREQSVTNNGHALAMGAASSKMSPSSWLAYHLGGLEGIRKFKQLDDGLNDEGNMNLLIKGLESIHQKMLQMLPQFLVVAEAENIEPLIQHIRQYWPEKSYTEHNLLHRAHLREKVKEAWLTGTQVNFCAKSYPTVPVEHPDSAPLTVLGGFLRNGYLHRVIREQGGAYGGGASQDSGIAAFRFYSYRDPRLEETLDDFDKSLRWLKTENHPYSRLEEAILGVIGGIDKPKSPAGEAKSDFHQLLGGKTQLQQQTFRQQILKVSLDDLKRVAAQYLKPEYVSIALVTHEGNENRVIDLGLEVKRL